MRRETFNLCDESNALLLDLKEQAIGRVVTITTKMPGAKIKRTHEGVLLAVGKISNWFGLPSAFDYLTVERKDSQLPRLKSAGLVPETVTVPRP